MQAHFCISPELRLAVGRRLLFLSPDRCKKKQAEKEALDPDANYTEDKGRFEIPVEDEPEEPGEEDTEPI